LLEEYLEQTITADSLPPLNLLQQPAYKSEMATLQIDGGKKQKVRPGDILGALTGEHGVHGKEVGKIQLFDNWAYVAVARNVASVALKKLSEGKLKGRFFRIRRIRG
jgi:ATP-independent RNA helicase DbpA